MRTLIISDLHGNRAALEAVAKTPHDAVVCLGDIVGYGPDPCACVRWVAAHANVVVQGNHDHAIGGNVPPRCRPDFAWLADAVTPWTRGRLSVHELDYLDHLPRRLVCTIDGIRVACFHAKPSDPLYGYLPSEAGAWARELSQVDADLVLVGHTHLPLDLTIDGKRLINPGSVGQPKDRDPRAAFALLVDGQPQLCRTPYPIEETVAELAASDVPHAAVDVLSEMLRTGQVPRAPGVA